MSSKNKLTYCDLEHAPSLSGDSNRDNAELFLPDLMLGDAAINLEIHEKLVKRENVSETNPQCGGEIETDSISTNGIDANKNNVNIDRSELNASPNSVKYRKEYTSTFNKIPSFVSPEGMPMDPLAPTALAVSSELMGHIGAGLTMLREHSKKVQKYVLKNKRLDLIRKPWKYVVNIVLVEAENLPDGPDIGANSLYCKFKLGTETHKSKRVPKSKSAWRERFNLLQNDETNLEVTVWHKYKQKNFMGRCVIDLSQLEKERTHDLWPELECGYGRLHLVVTLSDRAPAAAADAVLTTSARHTLPVLDRYTWYRLDSDWSEVGQLSVTVHGARGLSGLGLGGRADAYCVLELDNNRVQTPTVRCTSQPYWGKTFKFAITDITSTLDIGVYNETLFSPLKGEMLGKISIPLLRINEHEKKWFALKNRSKKSGARGNCPRILLEMSVVWNPIKASLRLISPKETKYVQKPPKFDIPLIYSNLNFIKDIFHIIYLGNEHLKQVFEWNNRDKSTLALFAWIAFWYVFKIWMAPLLLLAPFIYHWIKYKNMNHNTSIAVYQSDDEIDEEVETNKQDAKTIKNRLYDLQDLTFTIKDGIDYLVSTIERVNNLTNFTVPYLSYLAMIILVAASVALYVIPVNYLFMALGIYKYTRKYLNPERRPNNDVLDFLSRVPNNEILKEWRELKVPEPNQNRLNNNL